MFVGLGRIRFRGFLAIGGGSFGAMRSGLNTDKSKENRN